ncbi:uncharacterized protein LOC128014674 [Carassius gibelio]|uniref:uncharacterized protein LOC128014674 n=1 Tax=Carassius gibelio TaxID=101364 RepID=UPI0022777DD7|nr:uncharacterized protein LOC128014674 [Carassius gibelio]
MSFQVWILERRKGTTINVSVANSEEEFKNTTVEELKRKLFSADSRYKVCELYCNDERLFHDRTLGSHGIKHSDVIMIAPPMLPQSLSSKGEREGEFISRTESMEK